MNGLHSLPIRVGYERCPQDDHGNTAPLLAEVRHALGRLIADGEETRIDLNALPFGPGDEERLKALLGIGEVEARVSALGPTSVRETAIPGVWLVDYRNADDERLAWHIEIARTPEILRTDTEELGTAIAALDARLGGAQQGGAPSGRPEAQRERP